jgi:hypothetical protein
MAPFAFLLLLIWSALITASYAQGQDSSDEQGKTVNEIVQCLRGAKEVLLHPAAGVICIDYRKGVEYANLSPEIPAPNMIDRKAVCNKKQPAERSDFRLLSRSIIKDILRLAAQDLDTSGIRIIGGIYCDGIDLIGVNLHYSLVLDRSIVAGSIDAPT